MEIVTQRSRLWNFNAHAVLSAGEAAVIDPGIFPDEIEKFRTDIEARGHRVTHVILTHSHQDHIRGWQRFPEAKVVMTRVAAEKDAAARRRILAAKTVIDGKDGSEDPDFSYPEADLIFDQEIKISIGEEILEGIFLPGHSNCIAVFFAAKQKALFSGDYFVSPGLPYVRWKVGEFRSALKTFRQWLEEGRFASIYPAHSHIHEGVPAVQNALAAEEDYFARLVSLVKEKNQEGVEKPALIGEIVRSLRPGKLRDQDRDNARRALQELRDGTLS